MKMNNLKDKVYSLLAKKPVIAAMFSKNWKRYEACILYLQRSGILTRETRILDYGCGHPIVAFMLMELGYSVVPYEPYAGEDEISTAHLLGIENKFTMESPPEASYDLVLMIDVIEHLSIIKPVMKDVTGKVRQGGYLFISTPNVLRVEMWLSFVLRQTGHPQPLRYFLESDNNYTHHQREFTMSELKRTVNHFGWKVISDDCQDTRPTPRELSELRKAKGIVETPKKRPMLRSLVYALLIFLFPKALNNNLLLIAQKK